MKSLWVHTLMIPSIYRLGVYPGDIWCGQSKTGVRKTTVLEKNIWEMNFGFSGEFWLNGCTMSFDLFIVKFKIM